MKAARILIVDDERSTVEVLSRFLVSRGHAAAGAASAEEAVATLRGGAYDLVLLDVVLPGITGLQALPSLRALTRAPLYVMSGQSDDDSRRDALLLGADGFLGKPLDLKAVEAAIAALPDA
ncbi:MAG: response regulator [Elusimicrobia bacterium]|nr:response regulator [Elusimicrobiota bacterium]